MNNIKFNYLYRDAGNYKQFGCVIFANPNNLTVDLIKSEIYSKLIDGEFFIASELNIPSLFFENTNDLDHIWHEFHSIENTSEISNDNRSIEELINTMLLILQ
jgi:hypothetical protein